MAWKIIQLLLSIALIIGGLSGEFVLRGTNSSGLLVVFGFVWLIYDIYAIYKYQTARTTMQEAAQESLENKGTEMEQSCTVSLTRTSSMLGVPWAYVSS